MEILSDRQKLILNLVIHEFTRTAQPVGSKTLVEKFHLDVSSATVRNELATLTEMGFLEQRHTSGGRVPTEKGFRYFVRVLMQTQELPESSRRMIEHQFYQMQQDQGVDDWMKLAASILATQSGAASLVSAPLPIRTELRHLALIKVSGKQVLIILVIAGGQFQQRFVTTEMQVNQNELTMLSNEINTRFANKTAQQIRQEALITSSASEGLEFFLNHVMNIMYESDNMKTGEVYTDGISNVLAEPEFAESEDARRALKILEEKPTLQSFLSRAIMDQKIGGIQILIGGEGMLTNLYNCSLVLARYGIPESVSGTIGVFGPMRMPYSRTIPTVRFMAGLLSDMVSDSIGNTTFRN